MKEFTPLPKFHGIQCLRATAALGVVFWHCMITASQHGNGLIPVNYGLIGRAGVDLFFVISGLIMVLITKPLPGKRWFAFHFLKKRLVRVVPIYWILTGSKIVMGFFAPRIFFSHSFTPLYALFSLSFLPVGCVHKDQYPVIFAGWTLVYEMFFYFIFSISLFIAPFRAHAVCVLTLVCLVLLGFIANTTDAVSSTYTNPLLLEFVFGCLIASFFSKRRFPQNTALALAFVGLALVAVGTYGPFDHTARPIKLGIGCAIIVMATLSLESRFRARFFRPFVLLGDASYSLYLTHQITQGLIASVWNRANFLKKLPPLYYDMTLIGALLLASVGFALVFYFLIERPLLVWMSRKRPEPPGETRTANDSPTGVSFQS